MKKECFWQDPAYEASDPLMGHERAKWLIAGGGVAGLFVAYFLLKRGERDIVLLERDTVGSGSTGHSAGMLIGDLQTGPWSAVIANYGAEAASAYLKAQEESQRTVATLIENEGIACDFSLRDFVLLNDSEWAIRRTMREFAACHAVDPRHPTLLEEEELRNEIRSGEFSFGEHLERGLTVNPLKFAHGVKAHLMRHGVRIYEHTPLLSYRDGVAYVPHGTVSCGQCIHASGTWLRDGGLRNYMTTIGITRPLSADELAALNLADKDMFLDDGKRSFHYGKVTADDRLLIGYGDVLAVSDLPMVPLHMPHADNIRRFIRRFTGHDIPLDYAWTGQYSLSAGLLPQVVVGERESSIGGAGTQIASVTAASYLAAAVCGAPHPLDALFGKSRG